MPSGPSCRYRSAHRFAVGQDTSYLSAAPGDGPALGWDTKTSWVAERFLDSSTPRPEVFAHQDHSDRVVTRFQPTSLISTASARSSGVAGVSPARRGW